MNGVTLTFAGNLTRDPELRFTPSGQPVCQFTVAATGRTKRGDKWVDDETTFIDCQAWGLLAENIAETCTSGTRVVVSGMLKTEHWQDRTTGEDRRRQRLNVDELGVSLKFATAKVSRTARQGAGRPEAVTEAEGEGDPWTTGQRTTDDTAARTVQDRGVRAEDAPF
jgi:single-strand DNA-binding protein